MSDGVRRSDLSDFSIGPITVRPHSRLIEASTSSIAVEPLVMEVLLALSRRAGMVVSRREMFEQCWGSAPVGDDSLNRVIAGLRKALRLTAGDAVTIQTVPAVGYVLRLVSKGRNPFALQDGDDAEPAIEAGRNSWRRGLPEPDHLGIEQLRHTARIHPDGADVWGMLALLCRYAAEYADPRDSSDYVAECQLAAERALDLDPDQPEALVALATVAPLFGRWSDARARLERIVKGSGGCAAAVHELAIVEMTTGRVREAKLLIDRLIEADPLAACYCYKSVWQHWSNGDLAGMDHAADRAIQLWPTHPAIWTARLWTLAHTERARAALVMLDDSSARPVIPAPMLQLLQLVMRAAATRDRVAVKAAVRACCSAAHKGPALAVAALLALGLFDAVDEAFEVAYAYYARAGDAPVPVRHMAGEASINDQHRRVTQPLFTPAAQALRADARFTVLCERIGLTAYWRDSGLEPDYFQGQ
jgi:tetratricopeptide (TPR) repeat protein